MAPFPPLARAGLAQAAATASVLIQIKSPRPVRLYNSVHLDQRPHTSEHGCGVVLQEIFRALERTAHPAVVRRTKSSSRFRACITETDDRNASTGRNRGPDRQACTASAEPGRAGAAPGDDEDTRIEPFRGPEALRRRVRRARAVLHRMRKSRHLPPLARGARDRRRGLPEFLPEC